MREKMAEASAERNGPRSFNHLKHRRITLVVTPLPVPLVYRLAVNSPLKK
jgi:hypothetical protein